MTQLGKVLKGLKCCKGDHTVIDNNGYKGCTECPYCYEQVSVTGSVTKFVCHHKDLMQDTIDILESYVKTDINQKQQIKAHQDWIDSWSDSNYL